jgi:hypothetical protein
MPTVFGDIWQALKDHDAPNWFVIFVSLFIWPAILSAFFYWWNNRKRQGIPHLVVSFDPFQIVIGDEYNAVKITFTNRTGAVVYLHHARLRDVRRRFPIPQAAKRDMLGGWRELKFAVPPEGNAFVHHECILQTTLSAATCIAVTQPMPKAFYIYQPGWLRRKFRYPKYFLIEYAVMVGEKKYSVAAVY